MGSFSTCFSYMKMDEREGWVYLFKFLQTQLKRIPPNDLYFFPVKVQQKGQRHFPNAYPFLQPNFPKNFPVGELDHHGCQWAGLDPELGFSFRAFERSPFSKNALSCLDRYRKQCCKYFYQDNIYRDSFEFYVLIEYYHENTRNRK